MAGGGAEPGEEVEVYWCSSEVDGFVFSHSEKESRPEWVQRM